MLKEPLQHFVSGSMILLSIVSELRMILKHIRRRVIGNVLSNTSPPYIFLSMLLQQDFVSIDILHLAIVSMNAMI